MKKKNLVTQILMLNMFLVNVSFTAVIKLFQRLCVSVILRVDWKLLFILILSIPILKLYLEFFK